MRVSLMPTLLSDLAAISSLELASYPSDEAASLDTLEYRQREAGEYFRKIMVDDDFGGFICGTLCNEFTAESMSTHLPSGECLAIHSVVVEPSLRRRGVALAGLRQYVSSVSPQVKSIKLIAKAELLGLYRTAGFEIVGLSSIQHGSDRWFECKLDRPRDFDVVQVDAFSDKIFGGNPAAVLFTQGTEEWMRQVAAENNLAETAFLSEIEEKKYSIRWFTPTTEVDLCGHATLAAAKALFVTDRVSPGSGAITFVTQNAGELTVEPRENDWLEMNFPSSHLEKSEEPSRELLEALGIEKKDVEDYGVGPTSVPDRLVRVSPSTFSSLIVDLAKLGACQLSRGVIVTALSPDYDFQSRFFAPAAGIPEDPVTGSAHTILTPYWESQQLAQNEKEFLLAYQASLRGGVLRVKTSGERTIIQGQATLVFRGRGFS